ncbi:transposase [Methylohalobius crimeensis]|uniref:transposase n=1 Tax=Methylohalobius crimeensis TaxID=244365 RepID=UPI0004080AEB|nr:transposase [Methylohalobius crimeensis]
MSLAGWVLVLTHLPPELLPTETLGELYRLRWQVELYIKRLKSLLAWDRLRARQGSELARVYLYGKLLYTLVLEQLAGQRFGRQWTCLDRPRQGTGWRLWQLLKQAIDTAIQAPWHWQTQNYDPCRKVMMERPRKRALQTLPGPVIELLAHCRKQGLSNA